MTRKRTVSAAVALLFCFAAILVAGCGSGAPGPGETLKANLEKYKQCYKAQDFVCVASMSSPAIVEEAGGTEAVVAAMKNMGAALKAKGAVMDPAKLELLQPGQIIQEGDFMASVVPTKQPVVVQGMKGLIEASALAFSEDGGATWYFMEGNDSTRMMLSDIAPELLRKMTIPTPKFTIGKTVLIQKNDEWVKQ